VDAALRPLLQAGRVRLGTPVEKIRRQPEGVEIVSTLGAEQFDHVVLATHSDQALRLLSDPDRLERRILGAIAYQPNRATLHTDPRLMPRHHKAWASWNYQHLGYGTDRATLTYYLNRLQGIASATPVLVTLNQADAIDPERVIAHIDYEHPVLGVATVAAQRRHCEINGARRTWFCGAYWGYGFHEDGVRSAVQTCSALGARL
jgi:predicted NAD/FAD-binding protein